MISFPINFFWQYNLEKHFCIFVKKQGYGWYVYLHFVFAFYFQGRFRDLLFIQGIIYFG